MTPFRVFLHRLRGLFFKQRADWDLDDELRFHVEMQVDENLRAGMAPEKAQANALNWTAWRGETRLFEAIAISRAKNFNFTGDGQPDRVVGAQASWNLFEVLGVQPLLGRMFTEDEIRRDAKLTMLSYGFPLVSMRGSVARSRMALKKILRQRGDK
jgi:hypothetical protein